jgi:integrase
MTVLLLETLHQRIAQSELGEGWINDPLMQKDIWPLTALGYTKEECRIKGSHWLYFSRISLPWLKVLTKLTVKARVRERHSLGIVSTTVSCLVHLDAFLLSRGYLHPIGITDSLLKKFIAENNSGARHIAISFSTRLWAEEGWLNLPFIPLRIKNPTPKVETIPEEVLHQVYEHLDFFPPPLERLFRLQIALGCRLVEILTLPRQCLQREQENWYLLRWVAKRKHWRYCQVHPLIAELVQEQQRLLNTQFGIDSPFDRLFCKVSISRRDKAFSADRQAAKLFYQPKCMTAFTVSAWLRTFSETADLKDKHGNRFHLTSHKFRRTKASVMAYCEAEDEYIAAVLGHGSLDMLPHYRNRSLERLERQSQTKGYVDLYGRITTFKPSKQRYEQLAELLMVSTALGECHRPTMLGDCQARYACLSCQHHRVTEADQLQLEADRIRMQNDLEKSQAEGQQRRVTEIERLLELVNSRLNGLKELQALIEEVKHEPV